MKRSTTLFGTGIVTLLALGLGCQQASTTKRPATAGSNSQQLVFHTQSRIFTLSTAALTEKVKERVNGFFLTGAACVDRDHDGDGVPDTEDDCDDSHAGTSTSVDGGVVVASSGEQEDENEIVEDGDGGTDSAPRCERCNRGPGKGGDFRFEVNGSEAKLDRGTVLAASATELTIKGPSGLIHLLLSADTRFDDGTPTPGSEVRAEGVGTRAADGWNIAVSRVKVLCPGPQTIPEGDVPVGSTPVDPTGDAGTPGADGGTQASDAGTPAPDGGAGN